MAVECESGGVGSFSRKVDFQLPTSLGGLENSTSHAHHW